MLNKIDEKIFDKITMQQNNMEDFDVIVYSANYNNAKCFFDKNKGQQQPPGSTDGGPAQ